MVTATVRRPFTADAVFLNGSELLRIGGQNPLFHYSSVPKRYRAEINAQDKITFEKKQRQRRVQFDLVPIVKVHVFL
jgi:hypothetical protein